MPWHLWEAVTTGKHGANQRQRETHANLMRFWADNHRHETALRLHQSGSAVDPITARTIKRIYLSAAKAQQDKKAIDKITQLEAEIRHAYQQAREAAGVLLARGEGQVKGVRLFPHHVGR